MRSQGQQEDEERTVSSSSALLYHLDSESKSAQRKRTMTRTVLLVTALAVIALVASSVIDAQPNRQGLDVSMKVKKQGSLSLKANYGCADGHYQAAGGNTCYPCPKGYKCENDAKTRCDPGEYQDEMGQKDCKVPGCGCYVPTAGSTQRYRCRTGFYQPDGKGKATKCLAADKGYFVSETSNKCKQEECAEGYYQDCKGQGTCMIAPCGHKATGKGTTAPRKCLPGEYQDKTGQGKCKNADVGHYALEGACHQTECKPGRYQDAAGQDKCKDASCGTFVSSQKQGGTKPCPKGTYQPDAGARSCLPIPKGAKAATDRCGYIQCKKGTFQVKKTDGSYECQEARCGHFVKEDGQDEESPCPVGTYQPKTGQAECLDAEPGYVPIPSRCGVVKCVEGTFKAGKGQSAGDKCTPCPMGKFQYLKGQDKCLPAPCGTFVDQQGQRNASPCPAGEFQARTGQTSCDKAGQGKYAPGGGCEERRCAVGTYTDSAGQSTCKDADCGHYVATEGSSMQLKCESGKYQPLTAQSSCVVAPKGAIPGKNEKGEERCAVKECDVGTYQDKEGQTSCEDAECGHYVNQKGSAQQFKCPDGRYASSTGSAKCTIAPKGKFVSDGCKVEDCPDGTYSDCKGQTKCYPVPCGYKPLADKTGIAPCPAGKYQDRAGEMGCKDARAGHFTDGPAYCFDEPCERGTYQPRPGRTSCIEASCGEFVPVEGALGPSDCPAGTYQPSKGSVGCLKSTIRLAPKPKTCHPAKAVTCTLTSGKDVMGTGPKPELGRGTVTNGEACRNRCEKNTQCKCFRFVMSGYGYTGECTLLKDCKDAPNPPGGVQTGTCTAPAPPTIGM